MNDIQNTAEKQMFDVLTGKKDNEEKRNLKVFKSELVDVEDLSIDELFNGFDSIKAITFSYDGFHAQTSDRRSRSGSGNR